VPGLLAAQELPAAVGGAQSQCQQQRKDPSPGSAHRELGQRQRGVQALCSPILRLAHDAGHGLRNGFGMHTVSKARLTGTQATFWPAIRSDSISELNDRVAGQNQWAELDRLCATQRTMRSAALLLVGVAWCCVLASGKTVLLEVSSHPRVAPLVSRQRAKTDHDLQAALDRALASVGVSEADTVDCSKVRDCRGGKCKFVKCADDGDSSPFDCTGGKCLFEHCHGAECRGGGCLFVGGRHLSCSGGGCSFFFTDASLGHGFCDGGGCRYNGVLVQGNLGSRLSERFQTDARGRLQSLGGRMVSCP
jgi:hypothetical protein